MNYVGLLRKKGVWVEGIVRSVFLCSMRYIRATHDVLSSDSRKLSGKRADFCLCVLDITIFGKKFVIPIFFFHSHLFERKGNKRTQRISPCYSSFFFFLL